MPISDGVRIKHVHSHPTALAVLLVIRPWRSWFRIWVLGAGRCERWVPGDLEVATGELRVTLHEQASPHRTRVLEHLCHELNTINAKFPGSDLVLRFAVRDAQNVAGSDGG